MELNGTIDVLAPLAHYTGTRNGASLVLQGVASPPVAFIVICEAPPGQQGAFRDVRYTGGTLTATVNGNTITGATTDTWTEFAAGTQTSLATMVAEFNFSITKASP